MHYDKVKRDKIDFCNICGKYENLTWDHVPPKCCNNMYPIKVNSWWEGIPEDTNYEKNYQNGIRYVTDAINITLGEQHWGQTSRGSGTVNKRLTNCEQIFEKKSNGVE